MHELNKRAFIKLLGGAVAFLGTGFPGRVWSSPGNAEAAAMEKMAKRLESLEREAGRVRDVQKIRQLHHRYVSGTFLGKWGDVTDCLAENCRLKDGNLVSREEAGARLKIMGSEGSIDRQGGFTLHPRIEVNGDRARGSWLLYMLMPYHLTGQLMFFLQRIYDVEYIREKGEWKIYAMDLPDRLGPTPALNKDGKPEGPLYPGT